MLEMLMIEIEPGIAAINPSDLFNVQIIHFNANPTL